jgi:hypothetical protein
MTTVNSALLTAWVIVTANCSPSGARTRSCTPRTNTATPWSAHDRPPAVPYLGGGGQGETKRWLSTVATPGADAAAARAAAASCSECTCP